LESLRALCALIFLWIGIGCAPPDRIDEDEAEGYRSLPPLCLPCGDERNVGIASRAQLDDVYSELSLRCGTSEEATSWHQKVDDVELDFEKEALVILWDQIGTQGTPALRVSSPGVGLLTAEIQWDVPAGPARPVATGACFCFAVDKATVERMDVMKGGTTTLSLSF
jgi:hypothetical protein